MNGAGVAVILDPCMTERPITITSRLGVAAIALSLCTPQPLLARDSLFSIFKKKPKPEPEVVVPKALPAPKPATASKSKSTKQSTVAKKSTAPKKTAKPEAKKNEVAEVSKSGAKPKSGTALPPPPASGEIAQVVEPPKPPPLAFARPVMGRKGFVYPPGAQHSSEYVVDVSGLAPGQVAKDPRTGQAFLVP